MTATVAVRRNRRAGVEDLWTKTAYEIDPETGKKVGKQEKSKLHGKGKRWRARYVDEQSQEKTRAFERKADAQQWLNEITAAQVTGTYIDPKLGKVTFASFYKEWSTRQIWVSGTTKAMNLACNSVSFSKTSLADLRPSHVETWVKAMQSKGLEASTIRTRFNNVRSVLRAAVADKMLASDPAMRIKLPRTAKTAAAMKIPKAEEVGELLTSASERFSAFVALCAFSGLRLGESAAMQVGDIDFLRREIHVRRQVQRENNKQVELRAPKYRSERTIPVPQGLLDLLSEHIRLHRPGDNPTRWMFPGEGEHPLHQNSVGHQWRKARAAAGITYRLHDLRHFYASGLIASGCDVVTVQKALGHSSPTVTLNTYAHLWPDASDRTRNAVEALFKAATANAA